MQKETDIRQIFAVLDRKDVAAYGALLTEYSIMRFGNADPIVGKAAIRAGQEGFFASIKAMRHELTRIWIDPRAAAVQGVVTYTRVDDSSVTLPFVDVFEFDGGKISATLVHMDIGPLFNQSVRP